MATFPTKGPEEVESHRLDDVMGLISAVYVYIQRECTLNQNSEIMQFFT